MANNGKLINQDSGNFEYYTPEPITSRARRAMGSIDLDPFSSEVANKSIKAGRIYTEKDNGFEQEWFGNVWINHPFSRQNNPLLWPKIQKELDSGRVNQICMITYASTSEGWFIPTMKYLQCFLHKRTNYILPNGEVKKGVTKGSVVTYVGDRKLEFYNAFKDIGTVKEEYRGF